MEDSNKKPVGIYKYKSCNLFSLTNALDLISEKYFVSEDFSELTHLKKIILPGIGNMTSFNKSNSKEITSKKIKTYTENGGMVYGICLGLQLLLDFSEEANANTLGVIKGKSILLKKEFDINLNVGFHKLDFTNKKLKNNLIKNLFKEIDENARFYFLHKYYCKIEDKGIQTINAKISGKSLPSLLMKENILGTQFHPELSKKNGLKFLSNFCNY